MNKKWMRERELYNRAYGRFANSVPFVVEEWLLPEDLREYRGLIKSN